MKKINVLFLLFGIIAPLLCSAQEVGPLFLGGGGIEDSNIIAEFVELAGGSSANLIIIPTASSQVNLDKPDYQQRLKAYFEPHNPKNITVLHTRNKDIADSPAFLSQFESATGVWFWGGRSARLAEAYLGTELIETLKRFRTKGGVIGGTSAGAAIQAEYQLRGDPSNTDLISISPGFNFLPDIVLEVHFLARNRIFSLENFLNMHLDLKGIGIDEDTAIIIWDDWFEVIGNSYVGVYNIKDREEPMTLLSKGDSFNLKVWKIYGNCTAWSSGCIGRQ